MLHEEHEHALLVGQQTPIESTKGKKKELQMETAEKKTVKTVQKVVRILYTDF